MTPRLRTAAPAVAFAFLVGYVLLVLYVATTGDPVATVVAEVALAVGVTAFGLLLFVRPAGTTADGPPRSKRGRKATAPRSVDASVGLADATAAALVGAGFVRFVALVSGSPTYRAGAELLLAVAVGLVLAGWLRRRRAAGGTSDRRGRSRRRAS
jgi:uncharacterized membrane protein YfcA